MNLKRKCIFLTVLGLTITGCIIAKLASDHKYEIEKFLDDYGNSMGYSYKEAQIEE